MWTRREFLARTAASAAAVPFAHLPCSAPRLDVRASLPNPAIGWRGESAFSLAHRASFASGAFPEFDRRANPSPSVDYERVGRELRLRYRDLPRHFVFEYYPWYAADPWRHWDLWDRHPPADLASMYVPRLRAYDSRSAAVLEQHARWIVESGIGAINVSWWGRGSFEDRAVPLLMDVMRDHDIQVTFHLEPYATDRVRSYADDIQYLLREYGENRRWDCFLLLEDADGNVGPVFKSFRTIVPQESTDCHGVVSRVPDWVPDATWRQQTDAVRTALRGEFDRVTLLADVSDVGRMKAAGFDGMAIYDNYVRPGTWPTLAGWCSNEDLLFSFNVNPGFDGIHLRNVDPDSCYVPSAMEPPGTYDWAIARQHEHAAHRSQLRIAESFRTTIGLQADRARSNSEQGFFLVYVNSFNEWHEGHQFEPMLDLAELTPAEREAGYHNPDEGNYRLQKVQELVGLITAG